MRKLRFGEHPWTGEGCSPDTAFRAVGSDDKVRKQLWDQPVTLAWRMGSTLPTHVKGSRGWDIPGPGPGQGWLAHSLVIS